MLADVYYLRFREVFSVEGGTFCFHEEGVAVQAEVALMLGGFVFSFFDDCFVFLFKIVWASWVLTHNIGFASRSAFGHLITKNIE